MLYLYAGLSDQRVLAGCGLWVDGGGGGGRGVREKTVSSIQFPLTFPTEGRVAEDGGH